MKKIQETIHAFGGRKAVVSLLVMSMLVIILILASYFLMDGKITGDQWIEVTRLSIEVCMGVLGIFSLANVAATKFSTLPSNSNKGELNE